VGCYGAEHFAQSHHDELCRPVWLTLDTVGSVGACPTYLTEETFLLRVPSDPDLLAVAGRVARRHPDLNVRGTAFRGAYTEGSVGAKHGFRVLTVTSVSITGGLTEWHRPTDVMRNVDLDTVERTEMFVWELLKELDRLAGASAERR
jgi:hypothetical protein